MSFSDNYAYIPLFATAAVGVVVFVLLLFVRHKHTARVSFITFIADILLVAGSLAGAVLNLNKAGNAFVLTSFILFVGMFIFIPYCIILVTFEPKKYEKLVPPSFNRIAEKQAAAPETAPDAQEDAPSNVAGADMAVMEIGRNFMNKATSAFAEDEGLPALLDYVNKTIKEEIKADGAAILMVDDFDDVITVKSFDGDFPPPYQLPDDMPHKPVRVATNFKFASFPLRDNVFGEIATAGKPELVTQPELDSRIYQNGPEDFLECGSYIFVPMKVGGAVIGEAAFARVHGAPLFTEDDLRVATVLSEIASLSIKNVLALKDSIEKSELTRDSSVASVIQDMLHPAKLPVVSGVQIGSIWNPLEGVCGDYYDVIVSRKDRVSFVMSDIAGKGINSSVIMTMLRAMLRLVVNTKQTAGTILSWVNRGIAGESFSTDHFGSCALINYNPENMTIEFAIGGSTPVYYYDGESKKFSRISEHSEPIGVEKTTEYKDFVQKVKSGDIIVTCTDGLTETLNEDGIQYSEEKLLQVISKNAGASGKDIANFVKADIKKFSGSAGQHDDRTLLVIKLK